MSVSKSTPPQVAVAPNNAAKTHSRTLVGLAPDPMRPDDPRDQLVAPLATLPTGRGGYHLAPKRTLPTPPTIGASTSRGLPSAMPPLPGARPSPLAPPPPSDIEKRKLAYAQTMPAVPAEARRTPIQTHAPSTPSAPPHAT